MDIKISVIVPIYKVEEYLQRCIDSIIKQTYKNLEIILVDDGSPDNCPLICDMNQKKDSRIKVIHQKNAGLSAARNIGLEIATGDYISFVDSDDYINKSMYEILLGHCVKENAEIAICKFTRFYGKHLTEEVQLNAKSKIITPREALQELHGNEGEIYGVAYNKLYKRDIFKELRFPVGKINEDEFFNYKALDRANKIVKDENTLYYYYQGNSGSITNNNKYLITTDVFEAFEEREAYFKQRGYTDLEGIACRTYLDRIMSNYQQLQQIKGYDKIAIRKLIKMYRKKYITRNHFIKGKGYKLFYFSPKVYIIFKKMKNGLLRKKKTV